MFANPDIVLRDYQGATLERSRSLYDSGIHRMLWVKATGLGKTVSSSMLPPTFPELAEFGTLFVVHTDELAEQSMRTLSLVNPMARVGLEKAQYRADPSCDIVVTSRQTLGRTGGRRIKQMLRHRKFGIVITDEAHHVKARGQYDNILSELGLGTKGNDATLPNGLNRLHVGVTATPNRTDGLGLSQFFDEIACNYDLRFGITEGYLTDIEAYQVDTDTSIERVSTSKGDLAVGELENAIDTEDRNNVIVSAWKRISGKPALAFTASVAHAHHLAAAFNAAGIPAAAVDGTTDEEIRKMLIDQFRNGELMVLANCAVLTEGFDAPNCSTILMCRPTKSTSLYIQMIGRGTRTNPPQIGNLPMRDDRLAGIAASDKPVMKLVDFVDIAGNHKLVTLPSLFGLNPKFKTEGKQIVKDVVEPVEHIERESPLKARALREASSFEEVDVIVTRLDLWDMAQTPSHVKDMSELRWMPVSAEEYQLDVPAGHKFTVTVRPDLLGRYKAEVCFPRQYQDGRLTQERIIKSDKAHPDLRSAIRAVDAHIKSSYADKVNLMLHTPKWGGGTPSDNQIALLKKMNVEVPFDAKGKPLISKGEASALISAALRHQRDRRTQRSVTT
jgi:superfamily II DNA or RNA helicase